MTDRVNEGSFYDVIVRPLDAANASTVPSTMRYRIDCETTGNTVRDWTTVTPSAAVTVTVTATENAIVSNSNRTEKKVMTVQADYGESRQYTDKHKWIVVNLQGIT
jgi:hypothetical protein